jgi:hypothetical protein
MEALAKLAMAAVRQQRIAIRIAAHLSAATES